VFRGWATEISNRRNIIKCSYTPECQPEYSLICFVVLVGSGHTTTCADLSLPDDKQVGTRRDSTQRSASLVLVKEPNARGSEPTFMEDQELNDHRLIRQFKQSTQGCSFLGTNNNETYNQGSFGVVEGQSRASWELGQCTCIWFSTRTAEWTGRGWEHVCVRDTMTWILVASPYAIEICLKKLTYVSFNFVSWSPIWLPEWASRIPSLTWYVSRKRECWHVEMSSEMFLPNKITIWADDFFFSGKK
jgi:hypothetical protein